MAKVNTDKLHLKILAESCSVYGMRKLVISPGSRSASLTLAFYNQPDIECYIIPDERSAAYFALGIAQFTNEPVGIICTSGTAALNLSPAIAEAFHQKLPLLVLTADRPTEWIGQQDGQTINQTGIFSNFVSYQAQLPIEAFTKNEIWQTERVIRDSFLNLKLKRLPVHINIPLREPLYNTEDYLPLAVMPSIIEIPEKIIDSRNFSFTNKLKDFKKILLVLGSIRPDKQFSELIAKLAANKNIVVLAETLSNIESECVFQTSDPLLSSINANNIENLKPDLIISFSEILLSKPLKQWIRSLDETEHWLVTDEDNAPDIFQNISQIVRLNPETFIQTIINHQINDKGNYFILWNNAYSAFNNLSSSLHANTVWSDMKVFEILSKYIPSDSIIHLGNSTPVRYSQFFKWNSNIQFYCNRGTAGIDGCTSTAIGMASQTNKIVTLITGDVSFIYDSNALWNNYKKSNFKIIVINNQGGNIFKIIPGPDKTGILDECFMTNIPVSIEFISKAFGIDYYNVKNEKELSKNIVLFYKSNQCALLEVNTEPDVNTTVWKDYFNTIKTKMQYE